jgi:hypothetical protein
MAAGRCAGCGRTNSLRKISLHMIDCVKYRELFEKDPVHAPGPAEEYQRHRREDTTPEARAVQRGLRLHTRFAEINRQQAHSAARWATPSDILE